MKRINQKIKTIGYRKIIYILGLFVILINSNPANAQFGKNKVQYQTYNWMFIQTEHFDIYYDSGSKYLAEFAAHIAEKSLLMIQNDLNFNINRRIPLILYNSHVQFQQSNAVSSYLPEGVGGVTELFKNRVVLPFDGNYESFRHVIAHELVHAIMNDMFYGGTLQTALSSQGMFEIPIWVSEGLAEWESLKTLTPHTDMFIRDLVINNLLPELNNLDGYLAYRGGQIFYWYIADNYGEGKIGEFIGKLNAFRNIENAFKSTFNMTMEEFSEKWARDLKKMYLPDVKTFEDPEEYAENLTNHKKNYKYWNTSPAISPNGKKFAYIGDDNGVFTIFIKDLEDKKSEPQKLVSSNRKQDFEELNLISPGISWNPTGDKLAISSKAGGENAVFIVDANSGDYNKLTWGLRSITSVKWSPDGKKLALSATLPYQSDIFVYDFGKNKIENLTNDIFSDGIPEWSTDSKMIYFVSDRGNNLITGETGVVLKVWKNDYDIEDIYSIDITNKNITRLTFDPKNKKSSIAVAKNTNKLLFVSDKNGIDNIYELDQTNLSVYPKTNSIIGISQISISPDGSKLLFSGQVNGGYDIYYMRFPFEKKYPNPELPLTLYKESADEKKSLLDELTYLQKDTLASEEFDESKSYGNYELDFAHQAFVEPNQDIVNKKVSDNPVKGEEFNNEEEFFEKPYKIIFSPDLILSNPSYNNFYGFQSMTQMLFSDIMGDHQIFFQGYFLDDLRNSSFLVQYNYLPELIDYGISLYHNSYLFRKDDAYIRFRNLGLSANGSLPFDLYRRFDFTLSFMNLTLENASNPQIPSFERLQLIPSVKYVFDNTLQGWYGPNKGLRYYISAETSPKLFSSSASFYNFETDIRFYQPIVENYITLALRGSAGASYGSQPQKFFLGGTENWFTQDYSNNFNALSDPLDYAFLNFKMPLRGWSLGQKAGSKFFLFNSELRFPLFTALVAGPVPVLLQGVQGALFFDLGGAFDQKFVPTEKDLRGIERQKDMLMSSGVGVRSYLLGMPFKLDIAWSNLIYTWSKPRYMFSLGYDF